MEVVVVQFRLNLLREAVQRVVARWHADSDRLVDPERRHAVKLHVGLLARLACCHGVVREVATVVDVEHAGILDNIRRIPINNAGVHRDLAVRWHLERVAEISMI
eukprot:COSAG06_NODE_5147_length_3681_cov_2.151870_1_plen_104_part_10